MSVEDSQITAADMVRRARAVTASDAWDLDRRFPVVMDRADGASVWDVAGDRYVDFTSCSGAAPLGVGFAPVRDRIVVELQRSGGILPGPLSALRVAVAERLKVIFPQMERFLFFRTGSCATTAATRIARVHTGARTVLTSGYHGWHDWQLQYRPHLALPDRDPETEDFGYDLDRLLQIAQRHNEVAAVIVTPEVNFFPHGYVLELEALVRKLGALLILDEVMTGFRYASGGYHTAAGVRPDLIALSKGLANGVALSAVGGREDIMRADERTYLGNTYQREVTPFAAALATMDAWAQTAALARIAAVGMRLMGGLNTVFAEAGVEAWALAWPTMFDVVFADARIGHLFCQEMWRRRFLMQYGGRFMPSAATDDRDVDGALDMSVHALRTALNRSAQTTGDGFGPAAARFAADQFGATAQTVNRWCRLHPGAAGSGSPAPETC